MFKTHKIKLLLCIGLVLLLAGACWAKDQAPQTTKRWAALNRVRIFYEDIGQGDRAVILIHGLSCDHSFWRQQVPALAARWRVLALDLPGHGQSDKPHRNYSQDFLAEAVLAVMQAAGIKEAVLVGHSLGAAVAWRTAMLAPSRVAGLVSVDGVLFPLPRHRKLRQHWRRQLLQMAATLEQDPDLSKRRKMFASMFRKSTPPAVRREVLAKLAPTPDYVVASILRGLADLKIWGPKPLYKPLLVVEARNPDLPPGWRTMLEERFPKMRYLLLKGVGHFFLLYRHQELNREIIGFLKELGW